MVDAHPSMSRVVSPELLDPGFVPISRWRPDSPDIGAKAPTYSYGAVARKP